MGTNDPSLSVFLLGPFRVEVGGSAIPPELWTRRKAKALVKLLALARDHQLHRERIMEALWPGCRRTRPRTT